MLEKNKSKEKTCLFYVSDYHFEMITLPFINKNLNKNNNIIILSQNDLTKTAEKVIANINLKKEEKEKLEKLDWSKKITIPEIITEKQNTIIFVKGKEDYIKSINNKLENKINNSKVKIINCYDINGLNQDIQDVTKKYNKLLSTSGIENLI